MFALINDFKSWTSWSPWEKKDPAMKRTYGAASSGKGAAYQWEGNGDVGKGSMEITQAVPPSKIELKLDFEKPFEAHNMVEFVLEPDAGGTRVTWSMQGPVPYFAKIIHVFLDMDKMVGGDFEKGLAGIRQIVEARPG